MHALITVYCESSDPERGACSCRELLLIIGFILFINLIITSALLGNIIFFLSL